MAEENQSGPLNVVDFEDLKSQLKTLDMADVEIRKAKQAGLDIGDAEKDTRELRTKLMQIKQTYFPNRT